MGLLNTAGSVPALLFALIAGVWVDRLRRRPVPMMADLGRFLLLGLVSLTFVLAILRIDFLYLLMADESQPDGWGGQRLSDDAAALATEDYIQLPWPRGEQAETVYVHVVSTRVRKRSCCRVIIVRRSLQEPLFQALCRSLQRSGGFCRALVEYISMRWEIEVLFADGEEELGLDQYQLMSATALVSGVWPCLPLPVWMKNGFVCKPRGNVMSPVVKHAGSFSVSIDERFCSGFSSASERP